MTDSLSAADSSLAEGVQSWLSLRGTFGEESVGFAPIGLFPEAAVLKWVSEEPSKRGRFMARAVPKTLEASGGGSLGRQLLVRFGETEGVRSALHENFMSGGWSGQASEHYRRLRDRARQWLVVERESRVIEFLDTYIDDLNQSIKMAEVEEERRF